MTRLTLCFVLLTVTRIVFTQETVDLTANSWAVVHDSYPGDNGVNASGSHFFFHSDGTLLIRNHYGMFQMYYTASDQRLVLAGQECTMKRLEDGRISIVRSLDNRTWELESRDLPAPAVDLMELEFSSFRQDGFYYREEASTPVSYHYYRFLAGGKQLYFNTVLPPDEVVPYLNQAYITNEEEVRGYVITQELQDFQTADSREYRYVAARFPSDDPDVEYNTLDRVATYELSVDSIRLTELSQWSHYGEAFEKEYMLAFVPHSQLSVWQGEPLSPEKPGTASEVLPLPPLPEAEIVMKVVDEMPRFPGCEDVADKVERNKCSQVELLKFIYSNISYPALARQNGVEGTVVVTFVVEKDGRVSSTSLVRDIGAQCGQESLRVVDLMTEQDIRWAPGRMYGRPVRVQFNLPVKFKLESEEPKRKRRRRNRG